MSAESPSSRNTQPVCTWPTKFVSSLSKPTKVAEETIAENSAKEEAALAVVATKAEILVEEIEKEVIAVSQVAETEEDEEINSIQIL